MIAESAASVPLLLYKGPVELAAHPFLDLLHRPNPAQAGRDIVENIISFLLVSGNSFVELATLDRTRRELVALRPDRMQVIPGAKGWVEGDKYSVNGAFVNRPAKAFADEGWVNLPRDRMHFQAGRL
jgi:phage portal protein BeeE